MCHGMQGGATGVVHRQTPSGLVRRFRQFRGMDEPREKRVRWPDNLDPKLRVWLTRTARVVAHLRAQMAIFGTGRDVGGDSLIGNRAYAEKAAARDRTILHDALCFAVDECRDLLEEIQRVMDSAPPTTARPGSREKVDVMEQRARDGFSIFQEADPRDSKRHIP